MRLSHLAEAERRARYPFISAGRLTARDDGGIIGALQPLDLKAISPELFPPGTTFTGEGFTISVAPAAGDQQRRPANVTVRDAAGQTQSYSGNWICS